MKQDLARQQGIRVRNNFLPYPKPKNWKEELCNLIAFGILDRENKQPTLREMETYELVAKSIFGWLANYKSISNNTYEAYCNVIRYYFSIILNTCGTVWDIEINETVAFVEYLYKINMKTASVNQIIAACSALWEEMIRQGIYDKKYKLLSFNPWKHVKRKKVKETIAERLLTENELSRLIQAATPGRDRVFLRFLYRSGCRVSEAINLKWRDVRRVAGEWILTVYGKRGKTRYVKIPEALGREVEALCALRGADNWLWPNPTDGHMSRMSAWRIVHRAARRTADLGKSVSPHWLRHAKASIALSHGAPIHIVQADLGHANIATTSIYAHALPGQSAGDWLPDL